MLNPSWAFVPVGRLRLNLPFLLLLGLITYAAARHGALDLLGWLALAFVMWGWPALALYRARRGHYSWMYPDVTVRQLKRALEDPGFPVSEREREVLGYLAREGKGHAADEEVGFLIQTEDLSRPWSTRDGRDERLAALAALVERGLVHRDEKTPQWVRLELRRLAPLVAPYRQL